MLRILVFCVGTLLLLLPACRNNSMPIDTACAGLYQPVCGLDGKTYANACEAQKAGQTFSQGECQDLSIQPIDTACADIYQPVCGLDGRTYTNACKAQKAGQASFTRGECRDLTIQPTR